MNANYPISELRIVNVHYKGGNNPSQHYMHQSQVDTFVKATVRLHHEVGNPHTGAKLENLWEITVYYLPLETRSYWWCNPTLHAKGQSKDGGAKIQDPFDDLPVWRHPELIKRDQEAADLED